MRVVGEFDVRLHLDENRSVCVHFLSGRVGTVPMGLREKFREVKLIFPPVVFLQQGPRPETLERIRLEEGGGAPVLR